jgi:hypothetical protein
VDVNTHVPFNHFLREVAVDGAKIKIVTKICYLYAILLGIFIALSLVGNKTFGKSTLLSSSRSKKL